MDPFEKLPEEIFDQILRHFEVVEILGCLSLVSKKWYETIGKSVVCMQKIKLNLRSRRKNDFAQRIDTLEWMSRKNSRKYMTMQVNCLLDENISHGFYNFLKTCSALEYLNVRSIKIDQEKSEELTELSLPKLEYLKLMFIPRDIINKLLLSSANLRTLILWNETPLSYDNLNYLPNQSTIDCVRKFMLNNEQMEELEIQGRANFCSFFHEDITDYVKCRLKKFTLKLEMSPKLLTQEQEKNFIKFLSTQAVTLEYIYVDMCGENIVKYIFNSMPKLTAIRFDIELQEPNRFDVNELNLTENSMISNFELPYVKSFDDLKDYLNLVPNVKHLLIGHVVPRLVDYVTTNLIQLENLTFRYDDCALGCEKLYENVKNEKPESNKNIKFVVCNEFM